MTPETSAKSASEKSEKKEPTQIRVGCYSVRYHIPPSGYMSLDLDVFTDDPKVWLKGARMLCSSEEGFQCCGEATCWVCLGQPKLPDHGLLHGRTFTIQASKKK